MADAWGGAWGEAWGAAWGQDSSTPIYGAASGLTQIGLAVTSTVIFVNVNLLENIEFSVVETLAVTPRYEVVGVRTS